MKTAYLIAGIPEKSMTLYHRVQFSAGDPAALLLLTDADGAITKRIFIVRDIEADRARKIALADVVYCPSELEEGTSFSVDREVATAQAVAQLVRRHAVTSLVIDRSTPVIYQHVLQQEGVNTSCDPGWQSMARRQKSEFELDALREAQRLTELVMKQTCEFIANAEVNSKGVLMSENEPLSSEIVQTLIDLWLLRNGCVDSSSIVACGLAGADCHDRGSGVLLTSQPIIVDIFPRNKSSRYHGDCTRTVVHGDIPPIVAQMHADVKIAKQAAVQATRAKVTGGQVHAACVSPLVERGYGTKPFAATDALDKISMTHGTGHGVGLDIHEAPLLVDGGPELLVGDVITIEPGLYCRTIGGVRLEDMFAVTESGCENFNSLHEELDWRS